MLVKESYSNLRIVMNKQVMNNQDQFCRNQILQANNLLQMNKEEEAHEIIQNLLDSRCISFSFDKNIESSQPFSGQTTAAGTYTQNSMETYDRTGGAGTYDHDV